MATGVAIAGLVVSIIGTGASMIQARETEQRQKKQNKRIKAMNAAKASTAKRKALREERVRRGQLIAQAEAGGFGGGSTALAGAGLSGTIASNRIGQISSALNTTNVLSAGSQSIADSQSRQQLFSSVSQIGSSVFQSAGGFESASKVFGSK